MGKIIDIIYSSSQDTTQMVETLSYVCKILCGVFLLGGAANFGRVYLIQVSGKKLYLFIAFERLFGYLYIWGRHSSSLYSVGLCI